MFILLTDNGGDPCLVNVEKIIQVYLENGVTRVASEESFWLRVKETPAQILMKIDAAKTGG